MEDQPQISRQIDHVELRIIIRIRINYHRFSQLCFGDIYQPHWSLMVASLAITTMYHRSWT